MSLTQLSPSPTCILDLRANLGEGPVWIAEEHALYFVDIPGARVHRYMPARDRDAEHQHQSWEAPTRIAFLFPTSDGVFLCGGVDGLYRFDPRTGQFARLVSIEPEHPGNRLNDGCIDPRGMLWFGTMDDGESHPRGSIYRVRGTPAGLEVTRHDEGYVVSNGPAVSPDGLTLYACDSPGQTIYAFDLDENGTPRTRRVFARVENGYPDGIVCDSANTLWCCMFAGGRIIRFAPDGTQLEEIPMPCTFPTKLAFGGDDLRTAYVTTAWRDLSEAERAREPQAGSLFAFRVETPGLAQHVFQLGDMSRLEA